MELLKLTKGNSKLKNDTGILDLVAGYSCPFACENCKTLIDREKGNMLKSGKLYRCFSASTEMKSPAARRLHWHNFDLLKACKSTAEMKNLIIKSIEANQKLKNIKFFRFHASGDFFSQTYFDACLEVAKTFPNVTFYAYTKSLAFWVKRLKDIPSNFKLTASKGGKLDLLIHAYNLKYVEVVLSVEEAEKKGLPIDHDDTHAFKDNKPFALFIHGTQPAGSLMMKAVLELRKVGIMGYNKKRKKAA